MTFTRALLLILLWYFSAGRMSLHATLSFFSVWFRSLCFGASNEFVFFFRDCFVWLVAIGLGCFCDEFSFFFCASFTFLDLLYLRYFTYAVFMSTCFHLRYRMAFVI